ncbi:uncharacterized protein H6S33_003171 [Morchella sextelata]|uniref:uncharacterized protein n=1 Tax=Morchella sextelata TaxID=1174677 RepID=UPI001D039380|nr:uncharacterized protein H6S33_003171 [Morchella sextelata]KAH0607183.1 hypothetical protein H6S33_003171 [Morchella sextelata]
MDAFLGSPFGQMSPPDPPAPAAPRHASRPPPASAAESWSAQQSSLALRFYRLSLPGVAELVLSATKLDTTALARDAAMLEAAGGSTTGGSVAPGVNAVVGREVHGSVGSSGSVGGGGGGGGVSTPPETPSTVGRSRQPGEKSDRLIAHKAKSIMDLKQGDFDIQVTLGRISQLEYDPSDPVLSDIPEGAKPIAGFLLGLVRLYMQTENEHDKKTLQCVALYHLHIVFDGLVKNFRGKDARAKASEVLCHVMADMPMAKSASSFVTLATASRWLRELCDYMGGARFSQHLLYVRGDFTITNFKQMMTSAERLRIIKEALSDAREYYLGQLDGLYGTFVPQYIPAFYSDAIGAR